MLNINSEQSLKKQVNKNITFYKPRKISSITRRVTFFNNFYSNLII